jgi:predicted outer membrane protein
MKRIIAATLLALTAMVGSVFAQSAAETQRPTTERVGQATERAADQATDRATGQPGVRTQAGLQTQSQTGLQASQGGALDQQIAVCLKLGNQEEVALAQFAQDRAQNPQVKQFAQTMIEQHQQAISKLDQAVPQLASLNLELKGAAGAAAARTTPPTAGNQRASGSATNQQMVDLARDIKQECLNLTQTELGKKQGAEFDKCYIGQQIVAHTGMLAELRATQRHASSQLQPVLKEGAQMAEHHLTQAKTILQQLESAGGSDRDSAVRPAAATEPRRQ